MSDLLRLGGGHLNHAFEALLNVGVDELFELGVAPHAAALLPPLAPGLNVILEEQRQQIRQIAVCRQHSLHPPTDL